MAELNKLIIEKSFIKNCRTINDQQLKETLNKLCHQLSRSAVINHILPLCCLKGNWRCTAATRSRYPRLSLSRHFQLCCSWQCEHETGLQWYALCHLPNCFQCTWPLVLQCHIKRFSFWILDQHLWNKNIALKC